MIYPEASPSAKRVLLIHGIGTCAIGFNLGRSILATFTALYPHIAESATIIAGAGLWRKNGSGWWNNLRSDGEWILDESSENTIIDELEGNDPSRVGWKERLRSAEVESEPIERWERENHAGHKASVVSIFRYGNVFDQHESYRKLVNSNLKILVMVGENDSSFPPGFVKRELRALGWKKDVKQVDGAGHSIVRSHPQEVAGFIEEFWEE
ncbi:hypothetical protein EAF04_003734 [Stromatinia cepivora]|nr:hypothetical protein EAF04_003734 [Stromatinia cepivora]